MGGVILGIGSLLAWGLLQDPAEPWRRLSDGSRVRVVGVNYGRSHRVVEGRVWQRLLQPLLPERPPVRVTHVAGWDGLQNKAGAVHPGIPSSAPGFFGGWRNRWDLPAPELIVWVRQQHSASNWLAPHFDLEDEHGCRFRAVNQHLGNLPSPEELIAIRLRAFPRRGRTVRLVSRVPNQRARISSALTVRAPDLPAAPGWSPEPLPQTRHHGGVDFTLARWISGRANPIAQFDVRRRGGSSADWEPVSLTVSDATGNSVTTTRDLEFQPDLTRIIFRGFCREEPVWKLRVLFAPSIPARPTTSRPSANWSPAPKASASWSWTARIPAPLPGRRFIQNTRLSRPDLQLEVINVAQAGAPSNDSRDKRPLRCPTAQVRMSGVKEPVRLTLVRVTDERGRSAVPTWQEDPLQFQWDLNRPRPTQLFGSGTEERTFVLPELPGARSLKLELVAHRAIPVEYLVAPPSP